ncbi:IclR family transcriptional regulator [Janibacter terrae]|uniref:IclR family transcriptional regulator n=1 Tax=Janibacter terrae TaxID=103817 RepID=UPI0031F82750
MSSHSGAPQGESPSILAKAFDLLRAFDVTNRVMTLTELARAADLPKSTVHRLLARLVELDVVEPTDEGYRISLSMARLASLSPANLMRDLALPHMARLHHWSGHTVTLGVLRGFDTVILDQVGSTAWHPEAYQAGARIPAHCSVLGKALLAWDPREALETLLPNPLPAVTPATITDRDVLMAQLRQIRATNVAHQLDESLEGIAGIASAIIIKGEAVGALGIVHPSSVQLPAQAPQALLSTVARLSTEIADRLSALGQEKRWMPAREFAAPEPADEDHDPT